MQLKIISIETDVLVIGGGLAGCMAAIKASEEKGVKVTLTDKSNIKGSGCGASGLDHTWAYIPPVHEKMGYTMDNMAEDHRLGASARFFRRDLFNIVAEENYKRVLDLEKWGIRFRYEDSKIPGKFRIVPQFHSVPTSFNFSGRPLKTVLTKEAKKRGVEILNRVQMTDLVKTNGRITGAVGVNVRTADVYDFKAKAVILTTGRSNRLSRNQTGFDFNLRMPSPMSGDGTSMASRIGLPIINMEFLSNILGLAACGNYLPNYGDPRNTVQPAGRIVDGNGNVLVDRTYFFNWENLDVFKWDKNIREKWIEERKHWRGQRSNLVNRIAGGEGPFYLDLSTATDEEAEYIEWSIGHEGKGTQFLRYFKGEEGADLRKNPQEYVGQWPREISGTAAKGIWVNRELETDVKNLFVAGDEVGGLPWQASSGAFTQGWRAGEIAAKRAKIQKNHIDHKSDTPRIRLELCDETLRRERGFDWKEVEIGIQRLMDFYCGEIRSEPMLERGLKRLEDAKNAPLRAENPHELGRCLDVKSIIENAELVLRSSLERKESRSVPFGFNRLEYPDQDDDNWLAFLAIRKDEGGEFHFEKYPVDGIQEL